MKIGLQTWGTDGDFMPFLALAIGLKKAGHKVTLAYSSVDGKDYSTRPDISGIELVSASQGVQLSKDLNPYGLNTKPGSFKEYSKLLEIYFEPFTEAMYSTSEKLCEENDLVIGHAACVTLQMASAKHNCPRISLILTPLVVQSKYVSPIGNDLGPLLNSTLWKIGDIISTRVWFKTANKIRKREEISQPSSLQKQVFTSDVMTIVAASEALIPRPADWKANVQVSGFLNLPLDNSNWQIPDELESFLTNGEPPVYMTFGSCMQYDLENATRMLVEAARLSGKRAIIQSNWENLSIETDSYIYRIEQAPHNLIFPRCASIVHHGGAGTTQAALLAGKPSIVIPHGFDQTYWASHLFNQGVAAIPLTKDTATPHEIAGEMKWLDAAGHIQKKASDIGQLMQNENGVANAVQLINSLQQK